MPLDAVNAPRSVTNESTAPPASAAEPPWRVMDAVHDALEHELEDDPSVFLAGIDVGAGGNVFAHHPRSLGALA